VHQGGFHRPLGTVQNCPDQRRDITKACKADYQLRCAGIEPGGGRSQACMKDHFAELDERCQQALLLGKLQRQ